MSGIVHGHSRAWLGLARCGSVRSGMAGLGVVRQGVARLGLAGRGRAGQGEGLIMEQEIRSGQQTDG